MKTIRKLLLTNNDSLMYGIKTEDVYEDFSINKKMFGLSNYLTKSKYFDSSNKLVIAKMKDELGSVAIQEFVRLIPKIYSLLKDNSQNKKAKDVNRNVVATISHNEYKFVLFNNKWIRHSMKRIQSKDHRIEPYEINIISLPCFGDKTYI